MSRLFIFSRAALVFAALGCARPEVEVAQVDVTPPRAEQKEPRLGRLPVAPMPHLPGEKLLATIAELPEKDLTNEDLKNLRVEDPGLDSKIEAALPAIERLDLKTVDEKVVQDNIGQPNVTGFPDLPVEEPKLGAVYAGRTGATKTKLIKEGGGNADSERAVALGLTWLVKQQQQDGGWTFDGSNKTERAAATGFALIAYLGAGITHKKKEDKDFKGMDQTVAKGLGFLMKQCALNGANAGRITTDAYAQAIAALALCEAYAMTSDPALKPYAQAAVNYIQKAQGKNGSWGYSPGTDGDTSITGWQFQTLFATRHSKGLVVNEKSVKKAVVFLDTTGAGERKATYGYTTSAGAQPGTSLTAIGLLSRHQHDNWDPRNAALAQGVEGLLNRPPTKDKIDTYYLHYATMVMHSFGGEEWKTWNEGPKAADGTRKGGLRDVLTGAQITKDGAERGSWDPDKAFIGASCGRLGTTALCVINLEVYYRHLPLYKRAVDVPKLDDKK